MTNYVIWFSFQELHSFNEAFLIIKRSLHFHAPDIFDFLTTNKYSGACIYLYLIHIYLSNVSELLIPLFSMHANRLIWWTPPLMS